MDKIPPFKPYEEVADTTHTFRTYIFFDTANNRYVRAVAVVDIDAPGFLAPTVNIAIEHYDGADARGAARWLPVTGTEIPYHLGLFALIAPQLEAAAKAAGAPC